MRNNTLQNAVAMNVSNGLSKIYVGAQYSKPPYGVGDPVLIYRKYTAGRENDIVRVSRLSVW